MFPWSRSPIARAQPLLRNAACRSSASTKHCATSRCGDKHSKQSFEHCVPKRSLGTRCDSKKRNRAAGAAVTVANLDRGEYEIRFLGNLAGANQKFDSHEALAPQRPIREQRPLGFDAPQRRTVG